jgi:hypothetical protein
MFKSALSMVSKVDPVHAMKALGGRGGIAIFFLTLALKGGEWSASRPCRALPPGKEPPVPVVQEAGWAPEPAGLCRKSNSDCPVRSQSLYR